MLEVTTPADTYDLVAINAVKAELGITGGDDGHNLVSLIDQASAAVAVECNRVFALETVAETFRLQCRSREIFLSRYPVNEIIAVTEDGEELDPSEYELDRVSSTLVRLYAENRSFWSASKIIVQYQAGYAIADVPADLQRAVLILIKYYRRAVDPLLRSVAIDGVSSRTYQDFTPGSSLPPEVLGLVANHRKPCVG